LTLRDTRNARFAAGHPNVAFALAGCHADPALRSSHQAVPRLPASQRTVALRVAELGVTFVARLVSTAQPAVSTANPAATARNFRIE
jgi:hypothetical protein